MVAKKSAAHVSPLRRARLARNWTLEDVVRAIDERMPGGSGVSASRVSAWERGGSTSIAYRKALCDVYELPPEELFADQDDALVKSAQPQLIAGASNLLTAISTAPTTP